MGFPYFLPPPKDLYHKFVCVTFASLMCTNFVQKLKSVFRLKKKRTNGQTDGGYYGPYQGKRKCPYELDCSIYWYSWNCKTIRSNTIIEKTSTQNDI